MYIIIIIIIMILRLNKNSNKWDFFAVWVSLSEPTFYRPFTYINLY